MKMIFQPGDENSEGEGRRLRRAQHLTSNIELLTPNDVQMSRVLAFKSLVLDVKC